MSINFSRRFYQDPYCHEFSAKAVWQSGPDAQGHYELELEDSAFYPEGGGQPGDRGSIGEARVLDSYYREGRHLHLTDRPLELAKVYPAKLDFARRFELMQQHSGEHLISGIAHQHYGVNNVGFHINETEMTLDFDKPLSPEQIARVEWEANQAVFRNQEIEVLYPDAEQLKDLDYRSKKALKGQVRIIQVAGVDCCACCGTHLHYTGEIGLIKLVDSLNYKGGIRLTALCGVRALRDYSKLAQQAQAISQQYSLKTRELWPELGELQLKLEAQEAELKARQQEFIRLLQSQAQAAPLLIFDDLLDKQAQKALTKWAAQQSHAPVFMFSGEQEFYRYVWNSPEDLTALHQDFLSKLAARGGGKEGFYQGQCSASQLAILDYFKEAVENLYSYKMEF